MSSSATAQLASPPWSVTIRASATTAGNGISDEPSLSADGRYVAYRSTAANLVAGESAGNGGTNIYLYDQVTGITTLVSHASASATTTGNGLSDTPVLSADGSHVAFTGLATNLVAGETDTNADLDVFLYDRVAGTNYLVSHSSAAVTTAANNSSDLPTVSRRWPVRCFSQHGHQSGSRAE